MTSVPAEQARPSRLVVLGITGNWAFAAGTLLLALRRHSPHLGADILLYHDAALSPADKELLEGLGARCQLFEVACQGLRPEALQLLSPLSLAKLQCFRLLRQYHSVLWLDADIVLQDDVEELFSYGPLALATEDPEFTEEGQTAAAAVNLYEPVPGFDMSAPNLNSGVIVWQRDLQGAEALGQSCMDFVAEYAPKLHLPDQAAFNWLAQQLQRERPADLVSLPRRFNCHPRNVQALHAAVVHAFGAYKLWEDCLTAACFPEWQRDYARWQALGGSGYTGPVENPQYGQGGAFYLLRGLFKTITQSEQCLTRLEAELKAERMRRQKLEELVRRMTPHADAKPHGSVKEKKS